ncbi:F0F1 ATP synthase subunit A [Acidimangrovimonas sediminis]|uniref:F0F1 ATP synthase subunit A n=1 Tax=Acidimangrovimonas sediminis TaxID=2056283 RepID=UPI000C8034F0|nr:F0F1 ATP synthase subunit A [Acidimangrovimonas sediminis]
MAAEQGSSLAIHPMAQFAMKPLFGGDTIHWYTPTNQTLWMAIAILGVFLLLVVGSRGRAVIPSRAQSVAEVAYGFVYKMVEDIAGKDGLKFFPYVMTIFMFVVFANMLSLIPASFATTSHFAITGTLALLVFFSVTIIGFVRHGLGFLGLFWVTAAPLPLRPFLALIEVISYFVRPVSHSIRLGGNMMAGHAVLEVFAAFAAIALISPLSVIGIAAMYALELLVAFVQAYVFTILTVVYLKDALHPHH